MLWDGRLRAIFLGGWAAICLLMAISVFAVVRRNRLVVAAWFVAGAYALPFALFYLLMRIASGP